MLGRRRRVRRSPSCKDSVSPFTPTRKRTLLSCPLVDCACSLQWRPHRSPDDDLVELLWHNGSVVAQPQAHHRPAPPSDRDCPGTSGLTAEETAAWFPDTLDDSLEKDLYTQLWYSTIADAAPQHEGTFPGITSHPPPPPVGRSGVESSWAGDICSTFCGSNQVPRTPTGIRGKDAALQSEVPSGAGAHDGTSSSGGSGSNYGGSGLPSDSVHIHKRKGMCRDESDSRSEVSTFVLYNLYPERTARK
jgi:phytochrome-interacting factor 4